jgi:hypothetical protein
MPPRYSYWTILAGGLPTAFRAAERDELLPTFHRIRHKHPDAELKWFARGRLWDSPEAAQDDQHRERERRDRNWRPGGEHRDPRQTFKDAKRDRNQAVRKKRFERKTRTPVIRSPAQPVRPTEPPGLARPSRPSAPAGSTRPTGPAGSTKSDKANRPAAATRPAGPTRPARPAGVVRPAGPTGPARPTKPTGGLPRPSRPSGPAGSSRPTGPAGSSRPTRPVGSSRPTGPAGATGPTKPRGPARPSGSARPPRFPRASDNTQRKRRR